MEHDHKMSERKAQLLRAIIDAHIANGEPVGSKYLTSDNQISVSPATIRNEMSELEEMGYLKHLHTSSGRVPSENGYRFYVNNILQNYRINVAQMQQLNDMMQTKLSRLDDMLEDAGKLISSLTHYTAVYIKPGKDGGMVNRYKLVYLDNDTFLVVMIMTNGEAVTKQVRCNQIVNESDLTVMENLLNEELSSVSADMISMPKILSMEKRYPEYTSVIDNIVRVICETLEDNSSADIGYKGMNQLLQYPEFSSPDSIREIMDTLENKESVLQLVKSGQSNDDVNVYIGSESFVKGMKNSSMVYKTILSDDGKPIGVIGVIGPKRMNYGDVISAVKLIAEKITDSVAGKKTNRLSDKNT